MRRIKVLVVDDHALYRRGVTAEVANQEGLEVAGEASDGLEAVQKAGEIVPDVIVMDLNMPRCSGLEATQALHTKMPQVNILVLTISENESDLFAAMKFGARGYILKSSEPEELVKAIFRVAQGEVIVSSLMATNLLTEFNNSVAGVEKEATSKTGTNLSPREDDVLQLVAQGATNKEIADSLFISENTVKTHLKNIMEKLHLANRSQAAAYAVKRGLVHYRE